MRPLPLLLAIALGPWAHASDLSQILQQAEQAAAAGNHPEAIQRLEEAVSLAPQADSLRFRLASQLAFAGRFDEASQHFRALAHAANPDLAQMAQTSLAAIDQEKARREAFRIREEQFRERERILRAEQSRREADLRVREADLARRQAIFDLLSAGEDAAGLEALDAYAAEHSLPIELEFAAVFALQRLGRSPEARARLDAMPPHIRSTPEWFLAAGRLDAQRGQWTAAWLAYAEAERLAQSDSPLRQEARREQLALPLEANPHRHTWGEFRVDMLYLNRFGDTIFYGELRQGLYVPGARGIQPFLQLNFTLDTLSGLEPGLSQVYANNLAGGHVGLRVRPLPGESLWLYGMVGPQKDLRGTTRFEGDWFLDWRVGIRGFKGFGPGLNFLQPPTDAPPALSFTPRFAWFVEAGADAAYYSLYENFIAYGQAREGFRVAEFGPWLGIDLYALQYGSVDSDGLYFNNFIEIGGGTRLITRINRSLSLVTRLEYLGGFYLGVANENSRGDLPATYTDFRVTVSLWADW